MNRAHLVLLLALSCLFVSQTGLGAGRLGVQAGLLFPNPTNLNREIDANNAIAGLNMQHLGHAARYMGYLQFSITRAWELGFGYARMSPWVSSNNGTVSNKYSTLTQSFVLRNEFTLGKSGIVRFSLIPAIGIASYELRQDIIVSSTSASLTGTDLGPYGQAALGISLEFTEAFGLTMEGGYAYAKSSALKVSEETNSGLRPGDTIINSDGSNAWLDMSGPFFAVGLFTKF